MRLSRSFFSPVAPMECQNHHNGQWDNHRALTFITDTWLVQNSLLPCRKASTRDNDKQTSHAIRILPELLCLSENRKIVSEV